MTKEICEVRHYGSKPFEAVLVGDKKRADSASLLIHGRRGLARRNKLDDNLFVVYANDDGSELARAAIDDLKKRYPIPKAD
jgi:hypothetical protein